MTALELGWAISGLAVISWFVWRRRKLGPMTKGVRLGYSILLGCSVAALGFVLSQSIPGAIPLGLVGALVVYRALE